MRVQNSLSRRDVLGMAVAVGSLALAGGVRSVKAQAAKRIEPLAPELDKIIAPSEPIQELAEGFGGPLGPAEGPVWWQEGGYLLFSDIHNNRRMKYVPGQGVSVDQEPTNRANGLTRDLKGRLIACEHDTRRVTRYELDGSLTVIANSFQGRRLNRPNDVVVKFRRVLLLYRPKRGDRARAMGSDLCGGLPPHARSRHPEPLDRHVCPTERARVLPG